MVTGTLPEIPSVQEIRHHLGLSRERMARLMDVSAKTIERWEVNGSLPLRGTMVERLSRLEQIIELGTVVYTREGFVRFLTIPTPALGGYTALQLIELGQADRVLAVLAADYEGVAY